jgi:hypothetical protein
LRETNKVAAVEVARRTVRSTGEPTRVLGLSWMLAGVNGSPVTIYSPPT